MESVTTRNRRDLKNHITLPTHLTEKELCPRILPRITLAKPGVTCHLLEWEVFPFYRKLDFNWTCSLGKGSY